jgi:hypothetical protein
MIVLSFNARGVEGAQKQLALKIQIRVYKPDIFMIKETMCTRSKVIEFKNKSGSINLIFL